MSEISNETEVHSLKYGDKVLSFRLKYASRKTLGISVSPSCHVEVVAPSNTSLPRIVEGVENRARWIFQQIEYFSTFEVEESQRIFRSGMNVKFFGRDYVLNVLEVEEFHEETIELSGDQFLLSIHDRSNQERVNLFVEEWLRNAALINISKLVEDNFQKLKKYGVDRPKFYLRKMKRRWGSCTPEGILYFNPELVSLPRPVINYVVMHELCHLKYQDHSKEFYALMSMVLPEWEGLDSYIKFSI